MTNCESALLELCEKQASVLYAWCLLPNHYHLPVKTERLKELRADIGGFMDAIPFSGTAKTKPGADRSGTTALTAR